MKRGDSVAKALLILDELGRAHRPLKLQELSERTGLPQSTAHRLLSILTSHGYARQAPDDLTYHLGWKLVTLAESLGVNGQLPRIVRPHLERLAREAHQAVSLVVLDGVEVVFLECTPAPDRPSLLTPVGERFPAHATASGKALLATLPAEGRRRLLSGRTLERRTPRTVDSLEAFEKVLLAVRRRGYAVDDEETDLGVRCVAAAVTDETGAGIAAISVTGRSESMGPDWERRYGTLVRHASRVVSRQIAGPQVPSSSVRRP